MYKTEIILAMKARVYEANLALPKADLVKLTWGNVSEINRELGVIVIKPSGVDYTKMTMEQMVVTDLKGNVLEDGSLNPSSDLPTHIVLYQTFKAINAIVHTHSKYAVMWAQAGRNIPVYGTTHADAFFGDIPCTRDLTQLEVTSAYEIETGNVIVETFTKNDLDPLAIPAVIVKGHGPFTWGTTTTQAVENSIVLDEIANMALHTELINKDVQRLEQYLLDKHYFRKHGKDAYYGQK